MYFSCSPIARGTPVRLLAPWLVPLSPTRSRFTRQPPAPPPDKDAEILALRHQITVLQRRLGTNRPRFSPADRAFLAALLHNLPRKVLGRFRLLIRPDTVLRSHRHLLTRRHAARSRPKSPGRPRTVGSIRLLVLRLARVLSAQQPRDLRGCRALEGCGPWDPYYRTDRLQKPDAWHI